MSENHLEIIWGARLLDEGFTSIPNLLIRNYRKLKIEHGEYGFISQLLSYKHDARDPYPSRELLADNLCCSTRQVDKWVKSLRTKGLLRTGRRRNVHNKQWDNTVYSFKPLLDTLLRLVGEKELPAPAEEFEVMWDDEESDKNDPRVPEVRMGLEPEVRMGSVPEVRTKKKSKKENIKNDCLIEASAEIAAATESLEPVQNEIYEALNKYIPKYVFVAGGIPAITYIDNIFLMLVEQIPSNLLDPEIVKLASHRYFDRNVECAPGTPNGVIMKEDVENPVGMFKKCYKEAILLYKVRGKAAL